jgi:type I pantothenate kinase
MMNLAPYLSFSRHVWQEFKRDTPLNLTEQDIIKLHGRYESVTLQEVIEVYLPLSRLLNLYVVAAQNLFQVTAKFLGHPEPRVPYIIGIAGSVAVGKSTTSRVLQALLSRWDSHPNVEIVTTDGFLYSNAYLEEHQLQNKKGFPESYDLRKLIYFLHDLKAGKKNLKVPVYSHQYYDLTSEEQVINRPDIVILEGLNLLQHGNKDTPTKKRQMFVTDYIDFSIYVHAEIEVIKKWYHERFMKFLQMAKENPNLYLHRFSKMSDDAAFAIAEHAWTEINEKNLRENILPYRERAKLILNKNKDHSVQEVFLRKI